MPSDGTQGRAAVRLLTRVRDPQTARELGGASADRALRASILQHLQAMCSTRLGSMLVRPDYGLPAISEMVHAFPDAATALANALANTIQKYEPRLCNVRVRPAKSEGHSLVLRFEVTATMRGNDADTPLRFTTSVDASRRVTVE